MATYLYDAFGNITESNNITKADITNPFKYAFLAENNTTVTQNAYEVIIMYQCISGSLSSDAKNNFINGQRDIYDWEKY